MLLSALTVKGDSVVTPDCLASVVQVKGAVGQLHLIKSLGWLPLE